MVNLKFVFDISDPSPPPLRKTFTDVLFQRLLMAFYTNIEIESEKKTRLKKRVVAKASQQKL
jgi:hypothetical protein